MKEEITVEELRELSPEQYIIYDIRDSSAFALGHIDGSVNVQPDDLGTAECPLPDGKTLIICCRSGIISEEIAERLRAEGREAMCAGWVIRSRSRAAPTALRRLNAA